MALVMAMVLMPIILVISISFIDPIIRSYRASAVDQKTLLAKAVAENMVEEALLKSKDLGVGKMYRKISRRITVMERRRERGK